MGPMGQRERTRVVCGVRVPTFFYGTAWKEKVTMELVSLALAAGFRGIDTANQRRHYDEEGVRRQAPRALKPRER
jgi:diketogulonate reductase-like aldo/keto reductase